MKILMALWVAVVLVALYSANAHAEPVRFDCVQLAGLADSAVYLRDVGADVEKVLAVARRRGAIQGARLEVLEREMRRIWKSRLTADQAAQEIFGRCLEQLGDMGRGS